MIYYYHINFTVIIIIVIHVLYAFLLGNLYKLVDYLNYHFWINRNFQLQLCAGVSYRWVTGASVYFADIDNVGMIYMQGADYYPGLQNTWHIQGGIALNYQINNYFSLNMMPVVQYAIQSNIRHKHYVQQYQRQWGLQVQLSRKLGF